MQCSDVKGKRSRVELKWCDTISKKKKKKLKQQYVEIDILYN